MIQNAVICSWHLPLSIMFSRFHQCCSMCQYLISFHCQYSVVWLYHILSVPPLMDICVSTFLLLWIILLWMFIYKFLGEPIFLVLLNIYLKELVGYMVTLTLRNSQTVFQSSCNILHSHHQHVRVLIAHILTNTCYCLSFCFHFPNDQ